MIKGKRAQLDLEVLEEPGFWILGGGAVAATVIGYIVSRNMEMSLPLWQFLVLIVGEIIAAAIFASRG